MLGTLSAAEGALPRVPVGAGAVTGRDTSRGTGFSAVGCPSRRGARSFPGVTSVAHRGRVEAGGGAGSLPQGRSVPWEGPARSSCPARSADAQENAIGPVDGGGVREEALRGRHAELKDRLRGLSQGFDRLRRVSHQGYGAGAGAEFEEPRVIDLWDLAQSANLTEEELASLRVRAAAAPGAELPSLGPGRQRALCVIRAGGSSQRLPLALCVPPAAVRLVAGDCRALCPGNGGLASVGLGGRGWAEVSGVRGTGRGDPAWAWWGRVGWEVRGQPWGGGSRAVQSPYLDLLTGACGALPWPRAGPCTGGWRT